jgi:hypothetical protein
MGSFTRKEPVRRVLIRKEVLVKKKTGPLIPIAFFTPSLYHYSMGKGRQDFQWARKVPWGQPPKNKWERIVLGEIAYDNRTCLG